MLLLQRILKAPVRPLREMKHIEVHILYMFIYLHNIYICYIRIFIEFIMVYILYIDMIF